MAIGTEWSPDRDGRIIIQPGGPRRVDEIGPGGPAVLLFSADALVYRHRRILEAGASWDWPDYHPHITLSDDPQAPLTGIEAYQGPIVLGPEKFGEIDPEYSAFARIKAFAESVGGVLREEYDLDNTADILTDEGWRDVIEPLVNPLLAALDEAADLDAARRIVTARRADMSTRELTEALARATFATRFLEEAKGD